MTPRFASRGVLAPLAAAAVAAACLLLPGCPPERPIEAVVGAPAANTPRTPEEILAQAKREGEVCFYTSLADSEAQKIAQGFMREYPFLNCTVVRSGTFEIVRRLQSELDRNEVRADVLHVLDPGAFVALAKHGDLYRYESPQAKYYPPSMRSPGLWTACRVVVTTMAVRSAGGPSVGTWRDLMRLPHSVRIGIKDAQTSGSAYATYYMLREKYGYSFWEAIARRKPAVFSSENEMLGALKRREVDLLVGVMAQSAASEPAVRTLWPKDGVPAVIGPVAIIARAPHPNAAKLLVDFLLSHSGQRLICQITGAYPARVDVAPPNGQRPLSCLNVLEPRAPWELYTELQSYLQDEYQKLFHSSD